MAELEEGGESTSRGKPPYWEKVTVLGGGGGGSFLIRPSNFRSRKSDQRRVLLWRGERGNLPLLTESTIPIKTGKKGGEPSGNDTIFSMLKRQQGSVSVEGRGELSVIDAVIITEKRVGGRPKKIGHLEK